MEGEQLWDDNEETCDVLLRTLEAARFVATNTGAYRIRAEDRLQGRAALGCDTWAFSMHLGCSDCSLQIG